jgi:hypothetical protein
LEISEFQIGKFYRLVKVGDRVNYPRNVRDINGNSIKIGYRITISLGSILELVNIRDHSLIFRSLQLNKPDEYIGIRPQLVNRNHVQLEKI